MRRSTAWLPLAALAALVSTACAPTRVGSLAAQRERAVAERPALPATPPGAPEPLSPPRRSDPTVADRSLEQVSLALAPLREPAEPASPPPPGEAVLKARERAGRGDLEGAVRGLAEHVQRAPGDLGAWRELARALDASGRRDLANEAWGRVLLSQPLDAEALAMGGIDAAAARKPLVAAERLVGLMVLADRVNGVPYSHEELDLLKCIGDQLAGGLLNCSLTDEVLQAKELEAFQTLSTFFVHDLKNAANGLNLMLQNLPNHFDDPEFRSDAIHGVGRIVERINQLILKLGSLRRELQLRPVPCRLDLVCAEVLDGMEAAMDGKKRLERELRPVPVQLLDLEAMRSVVTNLVANAREALNGGGNVKVATRLEGKGVVLAVDDNGCGMSPDFVRTLLFRPFHSTKTNGLGIGMFQCKKIIEAHGGSISVESQPGKGTRFTILLPLDTNPQPYQSLSSLS